MKQRNEFFDAFIFFFLIYFQKRKHNTYINIKLKQLERNDKL